MTTPQQSALALLDFARDRTLATLDAIEKLPQPQAILGWRPGPGRAHIAWQLLHVGITEELFATERFKGTTPAFGDLVPRYKGGSTPDDIIPTSADIRRILAETRDHLRATILGLSAADLETVPPALAQRNITIGKGLQILVWHEAHHQGQTHLTLNLYKAQHGIS
ncbi:MAG: DinB family protein [Planctomycetaceae bacterium]|jgi:uncharacterized damage-inducible protein DinB